MMLATWKLQAVARTHGGDPRIRKHCAIDGLRRARATGARKCLQLASLGVLVTRFQQGRRQIRQGVTACAACKVFVHMVAKSSAGGWEDAAVEEYAKRLRSGSPPIEVETVFHKADAQLLRAVDKLQHPILVLDEKGLVVTSEDFAQLLFGRMEAGGARLSFVIGGADGLPDQLRCLQKVRLGVDEAHSSGELLSLGLLTLPHRLVRVVLAEQIYRAQEIRRGSSYHRGEPK